VSDPRAYPLDDEALTRYLLGRTGERETQEIEERYFRDEECFARLEVATDDLADAYAGGRLSPDDRARFERYCARSRDDWQRVRQAEALVRLRRRQAAVHRMWPPPRITAVAAAVLLVVASTLGIQVVLLQRELGRLATQLVEERSVSGAGVEAAAVQRQALERRLEDVVTVDFVLLPGADRASGTALHVGRKAAYVRFALGLENDPPPGRLVASVRTAGRAVVWRREVAAVDVRGGGVSITVPLVALDAGEYEVVLTHVDAAGEHEVQNYVFRLIESAR
jgi:hypothetical protein